MVDLVLKFRIFLGGLCPPNPLFFVGAWPPTFPTGGSAPGCDAFGFNPPSQLVLGYLWLAFLNRQFTVPLLNTKLTISQKLTKTGKNSRTEENAFRTLRIFEKKHDFF